MTGVPPFALPADQVSPILDASVIRATFARLIGASGLVSIIAPFPGVDASEGPTMLVAIIFAKMLDPHGRENGAIKSFEIGIVQEAAV